MEQFLKPTYFIDYVNQEIQEKAKMLTESIPKNDIKEQIKALFYFIRDEIKYKIVVDIFTRKSLKASRTLKNGYGFCITKATLLTALARALKIPSRLHFANIRNHRITDSLLELMGTNLFAYHGYSEVFLDGKWIKLNPAFDLELCEEKGFIPVEFDGENHALFSKVDVYGQPFVEYIEDHGTFSDIPYNKIVTAWAEIYGPRMMETAALLKKQAEKDDYKRL
ncbi:MAG: transglutaminase family protein [Candidatus Hodarchaeota archaeon]